MPKPALTHPWRQPKGRLASNRKKRYGLSKNAFWVMYKAQEGKCLICGEEEFPNKINVDHNHVTGQVRGLLCGLCNGGLGFFKDDAAKLRLAAEYLDKYTKL